jgi:hypothetical protein
MSQDLDPSKNPPDRGQVLFAVALLLFATALLSQIGSQTRWADRTLLVAQPRFWPAVGLGGMVVFGALHLLTLPRKLPRAQDGREALRWLFAFEWVGWFLAYVTLVPLAGYLPVTVVFCVTLAWRIGYRGWRWTGIAGGFGCAVVLLFKTFMGVKIPGAALYEHLPTALRSFFILNF